MLLIKVERLSGELLLVQRVAIAGAYLLKILKEVEGLFSLSAYNDVIGSGSLNLSRLGPRKTPL